MKTTSDRTLVLDHGTHYGTQWRTVGYWIHSNGEHDDVWGTDLEWFNEKHGSLWHADGLVTWHEETCRQVPLAIFNQYFEASIKP